MAEDGWYGNVSNSPSTSSFGDVQDERRGSPENGLGADHASLSRSPPGCTVPDGRTSLELLGLDSGDLSVQDMSLVSSVSLSSVVSSLYGDSGHGLTKPLSSNLRRLLEAGTVKLESGELIGRGVGRGAESPPAGLTLSPTLHHAQQLSALARRLAGGNNNGNSASTSPAVKQEPADPFGPAEPTSSNSAGFVWVGMVDKWPSGSLSPDSAIQKLKAAANAVLQDKNSISSSSSSSSSSSVTSSSSSSSSSSSAPPPLATGFDSFASPFSSQSASSTLAALSKKVSERSQQQQPPPQTPPTSFLSLASMNSSAALLKEVAARAARNMLVDKKEPQLASANMEDVKPLLDRNHKAPTPNQSIELLLPAAPKGRAKPSSQAGTSLSRLLSHVNSFYFCHHSTCTVRSSVDKFKVKF